MTSKTNCERLLGIRLLQIAVVYLILGVLGGLYMAATHQLQYGPVHTHVNLLGWATLAITGLVYNAFPHLARHWMAIGHAVLHNVGLLFMVVGMALMFSGRMEMLPMAFAGSIAAVAGLLLFAINVCGRLKLEQDPQRAASRSAISSHSF
jgi:hypothetical protein